MNIENLALIFWIGVPIYLAVRSKWLGFTIGMLALWLLFALYTETGWLPCDPERKPLSSSQGFLIGLVFFSGIWFIIYSIKRTLFAKRPIHRWWRRLAIGVTSVFVLSFSLGCADFCAVGLGCKPIFSPFMDELGNSGTTTIFHVGLGYVLFHKVEGDVGPGIWYWFLPFTVN